MLCRYFRTLFDDFRISLCVTHGIGIYIYWKCFTSVISLLLRFGFRFNSIAITDIFQNLAFLITPFIKCRDSISKSHAGKRSFKSQLLLRSFLVPLSNRHEINVQVRSSVPLVIVHNRAGYCKIRIAFLERRELEIGFNIRSADLFKAWIYTISNLVVTTTLVVNFKHITCFFSLRISNQSLAVWHNIYVNIVVVSARFIPLYLVPVLVYKVVILVPHEITELLAIANLNNHFIKGLHRIFTAFIGHKHSVSLHRIWISSERIFEIIISGIWNSVFPLLLGIVLVNWITESNLIGFFQAAIREKNVIHCKIWINVVRIEFSAIMHKIPRLPLGLTLT